jgi:hypothetical protein
MTGKTRRFLLFSCLALCSVLVVVLTVFSSAAPILQLLFVPYQYFLIGICVGALLVATMVLATDRGEWTDHRLYLFTVMFSVFLLVVINLVVFRVLGGGQFMLKLVAILVSWVLSALA